MRRLLRTLLAWWLVADDDETPEDDMRAAYPQDQAHPVTLSAMIEQYRFHTDDLRREFFTTWDVILKAMQ